MIELVELLDSAFSSYSIPSEREFLRFSGCDDPGKDYLRRCLGGKSQAEVMDLLRAGELGSGAMCTEELELAEPIGLQYYLHPFLLHFAMQVRSDREALDDETPFFLFFNLKNILEHRGAEIFTKQQLVALNVFVDEMRKVLLTLNLNDGVWLVDVSRNLQELRDVLPRYQGAGAIAEP